MAFDQFNQLLNQAQDDVFGQDADVYLSSQHPDTDEPVLTGVRVVYDEEYNRPEGADIAVYEHVVTLPEQLGDGVETAPHLQLFFGGRLYSLLLHIADSGGRQVWTVSPRK